MISLDNHLIKPRPQIIQRKPQVGEIWVSQKFVPRYSQIVCNFPFDMWEYSIAKIDRETIYFDWDSRPFNPDNENKACYWNSDKELGKCFATRLLPIWELLNSFQKEILESQASLYSCYPVHEPDYYGSYQITFQLTESWLTLPVRQSLGRFFYFKEGQKEFACAFSKTPKDLENLEGLQLLTSSYISEN